MWEAPREQRYDGQKEKPFIKHIYQVICSIKQLYPCLDLTFQQCPPYDSSSYQPAASYSQWSSWYGPFIIWTGDKGGDGVSIELPLAGLRTNPPNGEADGWLTTSIDSPTRPPLFHLLHLFLIPVACFVPHHSLRPSLGPDHTEQFLQYPFYSFSASFSRINEYLFI